MVAEAILGLHLESLISLNERIKVVYLACVVPKLSYSVFHVPPLLSFCCRLIRLKARGLFFTALWQLIPCLNHITRHNIMTSFSKIQ